MNKTRVLVQNMTPWNTCFNIKRAKRVHLTCIQILVQGS